MLESLCGLSVRLDWQALAGFAGAAAIIWAARVAKQTIKDTRRHHSSEIEVSTAQSILEAVYRIEQSLAIIRDPQNAKFTSAFDHLIERDGVHAAELRKVDYYERVFEANREPFLILAGLIPRGRAIFGADIARCLVQISSCERRIAAALQQLRTFHELGCDLYGPKATHPGLKVDDDSLISLETCEEKYWPILQQGESDKALMHKQFHDAKGKIEEILIPILREGS